MWIALPVISYFVVSFVYYYVKRQIEVQRELERQERKKWEEVEMLVAIAEKFKQESEEFEKEQARLKLEETDRKLALIL